jgi:hypothetical protein
MSRDITLRYGFNRRIARSNEPGTCLWCGKPLRKTRYDTEGNRGDYADNAFCGLRCGYSFGVTFASLGKRLNERIEE